MAQSESGLWEGGAYTDDNTGEFSHCAVSAAYRSGINFFVSVNKYWGWTLGFADQSWVLTDGQKIPINLTFDNRVQFNVVGTATRVGATVNFVIVPMPTDSQLINAFRRAYVMKAVAQGQTFGFNLDATAQMLPALASCVQTNLSGGAPSTAPRLTSEASTAGSADDRDLQMEAIQLATNFIFASGLRNPKVLSRQDTPVAFANYGAAWKSDEAVGAVKIVPPDGGQTKGLDVAAAIAAGDAASCKGKFASGRVSELIDSEVVFRGFSSCEDSDGSRTAQFFVVPRKGGGFVIFSVANFQSPTNEPASGLNSEDHVEGLQKAALKASE